VERLGSDQKGNADSKPGFEEDANNQTLLHARPEWNIRSANGVEHSILPFRCIIRNHIVVINATIMLEIT
jgi:hypothetical protein